MALNNKSIAIAALLLALGPSSAGFFVAESIRYFKNFDRYVEVKGSAEKIVKSDQANWQIGVTVVGNNLKDIYSNINTQQAVVTSFLVKNGFKTTDFVKQPVSLIDNYANAYGSSNVKLPQYTATAGVNVSTGDVDRVTQIVQQTNQLVDAGVVVSSNNVTYTYTGLNMVKAGMLDEALANAKVSAEQFAKNSKSELGNIKVASQGLFTINGQDQNMGDANSINKKVRVVTTVQFFLK